jgi:hypothetical protein
MLPLADLARPSASARGAVCGFTGGGGAGLALAGAALAAVPMNVPPQPPANMGVCGEFHWSVLKPVEYAVLVLLAEWCLLTGPSASKGVSSRSEGSVGSAVATLESFTGILLCLWPHMPHGSVFAQQMFMSLLQERAQSTPGATLGGISPVLAFFATV